MRRVLVPLVLCCAAAGSATACDAWLTKPSLYNQVRVEVRRTNGDPIPGVPLVLYTGQRPMGYATTDSTGDFLFTRVPQGVYGVIATPPSAYWVLEDVTSAPSSTVANGLDVHDDTILPVRFTFLTKGTGAIALQVTQTNGTPMAGVPVTLYQPTRVDTTTVTDSAGRASFDQLAYGVYGVTIVRPFFYRDFARQGDSLYDTRDNLVVEAGSQDSVHFALPRCAGIISVLALDQFGAPVPRTTVAFYTSTAGIAVQQTGADGRTSIGPEPCAINLGVTINPPVGYTVVQGRGTSYQDGINPSPNVDTTTVTMHVQKNP